ncbi:hypothetical protein E5554_17830 [Sphingobium sp. PAMC28499]|nr:hypothetical protein E5554_17830 [Sphingobium sp. PAMC28499]
MNQSLKVSPQQNASCRRVRPIKRRPLPAADNLIMLHGCVPARHPTIAQGENGAHRRPGTIETPHCDLLHRINAETDQKSLPQPFFIQIDISASPSQLSPDRK